MAFISWHVVEKPALSLKNLPERCWTKLRVSRRAQSPGKVPG
jgi:hypothetical protein